MAKLIGYYMTSANKNAIDDGYLVKAMCEFCGKKFGSIEEARKCETKNINNTIREDLNKQLISKIQNSDGTVDYVLNNGLLDEILKPFIK